MIEHPLLFAFAPAFGGAVFGRGGDPGDPTSSPSSTLDSAPPGEFGIDADARPPGERSGERSAKRSACRSAERSAEPAGSHGLGSLEGERAGERA